MEFTKGRSHIHTYTHTHATRSQRYIEIFRQYHSAQCDNNNTNQMRFGRHERKFLLRREYENRHIRRKGEYMSVFFELL